MTAKILAMWPVIHRDIDHPQPNISDWPITSIPLNVTLMDFSAKSRRRKPFSTALAVVKSPDK